MVVTTVGEEIAVILLAVVRDQLVTEQMRDVHAGAAFVQASDAVDQGDRNDLVILHSDFDCGEHPEVIP